MANTDTKELVKVEVINILPFCIFKSKLEELGIAEDGYFASTGWRTSDEAFNQISGQSFGWTDSSGSFFCNRKYDFRRPTQREVEVMLPCHPRLLEIAIEQNLVKLVEE